MAVNPSIEAIVNRSGVPWRRLKGEKLKAPNVDPFFFFPIEPLKIFQMWPMINYFDSIAHLSPLYYLLECRYKSVVPEYKTSSPHSVVERVCHEWSFFSPVYSSPGLAFAGYCNFVSMALIYSVWQDKCFACQVSEKREKFYKLKMMKYNSNKSSCGREEEDWTDETEIDISALNLRAVFFKTRIIFFFFNYFFFFFGTRSLLGESHRVQM